MSLNRLPIDNRHNGEGMEYKQLSQLYHMNTSSSRDKDLLREEELRRAADSSFRTGFFTPGGELFVAVPRELSVLTERVLRAERKVSQLTRALPPIACSAVLRGLVLDEVVSTNAIEDVHSTRRQVKDALESRAGGSLQSRRFRELGKLYLGIVDDDADIPTSAEDVRAIYDRVMDGEFEDDADKPDGLIFRAHGVDVTEGGVRILHSGLEPEDRIIAAVELMLDIMRSDDIPAIYSAIAGHYMFEYAHPFYDGNGRTGRYLLSLFLSEPLSKPTVLSLSRIIAENSADYYRAFKTVEDPLNKGELTFFVHTMLELIRKAQIDIILRLENSLRVFGGLQETIAEVSKKYKLKHQETQATYVLMQFELFGLLGDTSVHELAECLGIGSQMTRIHLSSLEGKGIVVKCRKRNPLTFALSEGFKAEYGVKVRMP